jgi:mRNA interferase RelE/StbE
MPGIRYRIEYSKDAARNIKKFPKNIQERIIRAIEERLCTSPEEVDKPLIKQWEDHKRLRVGDYRVIYKIYQERIVVFIVEIDHRRDVYED